MASGRKNRGSRHRSHRHKQQKGDDSGDSDAEQNLRHGPNPNPNPSASSPWTMEPLPPNVEGPSVLKQPDMENVDPDSQQGLVVKRRKESANAVGDAASVMDRWDGGGGADEAATLALLGVTERSSNMPGDGLSRKEPRGESEQRNSKGKSRAASAMSIIKGLERADSDAIDSSAQVSAVAETRRDFKSEGFVATNVTDFTMVNNSATDGSEPAKARVSKSLGKDRELEIVSSSANASVDADRKRVRKGDLSQKPRKVEGAVDLVKDFREEHHGALEKGLSQDVVRNIELEKELENRIRRRSEGSGDRDRDRWRDGGKERDLKGSRPHNEDPYQNEVKMKDEKVRQERLKEDASVKSRRERSSSRHRDDNWKPGKHPEDKNKEEGQNISGGHEGWAKYEKDHEQRKKTDRARGDRSFEGKAKDEKQEEVMSIKDDAKNGKSKDFTKDSKEKNGGATEAKHRESRSKDSRHRDEKDRDARSKGEGSVAEDRRLTSESVNKKDIPNQPREERIIVDSHHDDVRREYDRPKEEKSRMKGKLEENVKDDREKLEKHREEGGAHFKPKHDRRRGELEQEDMTRHKEDSGLDGAVDGRGRKRIEREQDFNLRYSKRQSEEGGFEKRQDDKEITERQKMDTHSLRESQQVNGKQTETPLKYEKIHDVNDRERDGWGSGERCGREKAKDDGSRHSKRRDESQERRWGGAMQDERSKSNKEIYDRQKHSRELDERQRYGLFGVGKQRGERGKDERKQMEKLKEDRHEETSIPVFERLGTTKEVNRRSDGGDKDSRRVSLDKGYDQFGKKSKDHDGKMKSTSVRDSIDTRESKGHATNKGDRIALKASRSTPSQDQERVLAVTGAKDASMSESLSKRALDSDMFDAATIADRDFARPRGRQVEEMPPGDRALHEKSGRKSKYETSLSSSSGTRRPRDQSWHVMSHGDQGKAFPGPDEEVRSWEPRVANQDSDDERRRPYSHERVRDTSSPRGPLGRGHDDFTRGSESMLSKDSTMSKRKHESFSQSAAGPTKHRRMDDAAAERPDWSHQGTQGNRAPTDSLMGRSLPPNRHLGSSALLPPPPPYRPGVDNPTVMGAPSNFVEGPNARDGGRYDRKSGRRSEMVGPGDSWGGFGMGSWNAHNQGPVPGPGGMFPSFPQMAPGFMGMGQQFHVPQVFGPNGSRPVNMGFGGRFRMGDGGSGFPGHASDHGPAMGWHRFPDGSEGHGPLSAFMHAWEGSGRYADERQRFGHTDWDQFPQGIPGGGWDGVSEPWQNQAGDPSFDMNPPHRQREDVYQAKPGEASWPESESENVHTLEDNILETPEAPHVDTDNVGEQFVSKAGKRVKERLQKLLLHANVHADLVEPELYKEYLSYIPPSEAKKSEAGFKDFMNVTPVFVDEDLEFEVDSEAQELLLSATPCLTILPPLSHDAYENCLKVFQNPLQKDRVQKSKFGSFLLPRSISGIVRPRLDTESIEGEDLMGAEDQECTAPGLVSEALLNSATANEELDATYSERGLSLAESLAEESDSARVVGVDMEDGIVRLPLLPDETAGPTEQGHNSALRNAGDEQEFPVSGESNIDHNIASEVADSGDWMDQNEVSLPNHLESAQLAERDPNCQLVEDIGLKTQALLFSSSEREELVESFTKPEATNVDGPKDTHRQEVFLDSTLANLP